MGNSTPEPRAVYPRWRGEHFCNVESTYWFCGLSPLARGTHYSYIHDTYRTRFIPAGAGNTLRGMLPVINPAVYPRWRGEHRKKIINIASLSGLSPLARGTLLLTGAKSARGRFIPAGAGNTGVKKLATRAISVYPRWRGEHVSFRSLITQ